MGEQVSGNRAIINWLLVGCFLIFSMVIVGGLTRLTHSGLSMVEWNLIMGSVPPLNEAEWQEAFEKYQQFPEYQLVNYHFTLEEFKPIFLWEYAHRMLGRLIGLVFIVPFFWFWLRGKINPRLFGRLVIILIMGGFQGFLGWYMVKSGLVKNPDVSHYRLAMHLTTAFLTFAYTFWVALSLIYPQKSAQRPRALLRLSRTLLVVLVVQIVWGAFVAGLNAGKVYTTWPKMGDRWVAESVTAIQPLWLNFVEGIGGVQFVHRYMAYAVVLLVVGLFWKAAKSSLDRLQKRALRVLLLLVALQFGLGVFTLIYGVPLWLGLAHQLGAFLLLGATVFTIHRLSSYQRLVN